jgi:hypothetical protein
MDDESNHLPPTSRQLYETALADVRKEVEKQGIMITLLKGWVDLYRAGYGALQSYGIDFMKLKEYEKEYPDGADDLPLMQARSTYSKWFGRMHGAIAAAIRRKQWRVHENTKGDGPEGN